MRMNLPKLIQSWNVFLLIIYDQLLDGLSSAFWTGFSHPRSRFHLQPQQKNHVIYKRLRKIQEKKTPAKAMPRDKDPGDRPEYVSTLVENTQTVWVKPPVFCNFHKIEKQCAK